MVSDNKVSSFFLLILIGLAIYFLLNREGFNPLSELSNDLHEGFADESEEAEEEVAEEEAEPSLVSQQVSQQPVFVSQEPVFDSQEPVFVSQEPVFVSQEPVNVPEIKYEASKEPYVPQSVINDIAVGQQSSVPPPVVNNVHTSGIFNFQPNDESELGISGSSLNDAFALPVPAGSQTDTIDFKKQNVDNYNARDFLPREVNNEWFETDFSLAKYQLNDDKLINPDRYVVGINTVGQSLKNASYDIRGTVPNPKFVISPFNNSTIEPDFNLKPLC